MPTRAEAKREAALLNQSLMASLSSPPATPPNATESKTIATLTGSPAATQKRKRAPPKTKKSAESVVGDWDVLPHGLGKKGDLVKEESVNEQDPGLSPPPMKKKARRGKLATPESSRNCENIGGVASDLLQADLPKKGGRKVQLIKDESDEGKDDEDFNDIKPKRKRATPKEKTLDTSKEVLDKANELVATSDATKKVRKKKLNKYGLTPGESPFPTHVKPTPEDCEEVVRLLSELHTRPIPPETILAPSMEVAGCGEVPDVLDAILRTRLSAATTSNNSNLAIKGLQETYGLRTIGKGHPTINWADVHQQDGGTLENAIKAGGLAKSKAKDIKAILDIVYKQNYARRDAMAKEKETGEAGNILGAGHETQQAKNMKIAQTNENLLSMDHVFEMTTDEAMEELTKLPGIGVKTASCVILFCMKRPSFAVDTHVWRHCKMLGWVPTGATRDQTFSHCEVRIPNDLKYALHQLFVKHGKKCGRCAAKGSVEKWANTTCPIEHLVTRAERKGKAKKAGETEDEETIMDEDE